MENQAEVIQIWEVKNNVAGRLIATVVNGKIMQVFDGYAAEVRYFPQIVAENIFKANP